MSYAVCGKDATERIKAVGDRLPLPICEEHKADAIAKAEALNHEPVFEPIPKKAKALERLCQYPIRRQSAEEATAKEEEAA